MHVLAPMLAKLAVDRRSSSLQPCPGAMRRFLQLPYTGDLLKAPVKAMTGTLPSKVLLHFREIQESRRALQELERYIPYACSPDLSFELQGKWKA